MIKYIIIDDEHIAHDIIKSYCEVLGDMQLMNRCYDAIEALEYLRNHPIDLIFLDINMPKLKGFDFLNVLPNQPKVIVTTAYAEFALQGYEHNVLDYLLKPFSFERFVIAVNKCFKINDESKKPIDVKISDDEHFFLYSDKKHIQVKINDIFYVEAAGNYCKIVLTDRHFLIREKISDVSEKLPYNAFVRTHKSFIVSKRNIDTVEGNQIRIKDYSIPIGQLYKVKVLDFLKL
ncbi:response regulator transcription factor [Aurantibacter sp.]|uniref:LytR/AlgR family response regulator transcription factor n=1 Tax=Aurantibacter sp. TaxID=2807103 RepID=UPI003266D0C3